jgi:hypothetical protein
VGNPKLISLALLLTMATIAVQLGRGWAASAREKQSYARYLGHAEIAARQPVTVGDPSNPDALGQEVVAAYDSGARSIVIRKGTYLFSRRDQPILNLDRWRDAVISGSGAMLVSAETNWGNELIRMDRCTNVTVQDLVLSQTWQTEVQGKVVSVDQTHRNTRCVWTPDPGYPIPDPSATHFNKGPNVVNGRTRALRLGCNDEWDAVISTRSDRNWDVIFYHKVPVEVGDWLVSRGNVAPCKVHLVNSRSCTVSNVTCLRNAFGSILENEGGGNRYLNCKWELGPKPEGATESPLVSCSVDGFHSDLSSPGPDLENCRFDGILLDDCISIHGELAEVLSTDGVTVRVNRDGGPLVVGQPVRIGGKNFLEGARVVSISHHSDHTATITLDRDLQVPIGAFVGNPLRNGQGFRIIGCQIGNTRSRGMLIKGDDGLIDGNTVENCAMSGLCVGPDYPIEGDFVNNLVIRNNRFVDNGSCTRDLAAILVHGGETMGNRNFTISENVFKGNYSGDIDLEWTLGVSVTKNRFAPPASLLAFMDKPRPVQIQNSAGVQVVANEFLDGPTYAKPLIIAGPEVSRYTHSANKTN